MSEAELDVSVDLAGNLIGQRPGSDPDLSPLLLGSHIDSVPSGGNYDGQVGSMAAYVDAAWWASPALGPSRGQRGQVLSYVRPLDAALVGCGPVWCSLRSDPNR